ncbi:MAG: DNA-directed RNA polymerase subunit H [Methanomassiliicoccales archaeon]|nr:MAG: DNA-directed RNA polymerase subunit H [Methanomassiliicoccales archaeon]
MPFNVMEHQLVPEHRILSEKEAKTILTKLKISKEQLPKIRISDPCIKILDEAMGPVKEGMIVEITRTSETAGRSKAYRLIIRR